MPGTAVSAAPCAAVQPLVVPHNFSTASFDQTSSPESILTARMPPCPFASVPLTPKNTREPSTAAPHCPPMPFPALVRYCQTMAPSLLGSTAYAIPHFDSTISPSSPFDRVDSSGDIEKS